MTCGTMYLEDLHPEERFILDPDRRGTVLRVGLMGVVVQWDGAQRVTLTAHERGEVKTKSFTRKSKPTVLAGRTVVRKEVR